MNNNTGVVYLFPSPISPDFCIISDTRMKKILHLCTCFFVENITPARRWIKKIDNTFNIDSRTWVEMHHAQAENMLYQFESILKTHSNIGIFSDAGCPSIADPGQILISEAHKKNIKVVPLIGANSILLALMASGMNGQQFCFYGYLPIDKKERIAAIKSIEISSRKNHTTQIFIETPYRNQSLFDTLLNVCHQNTFLCIASNITAASESIKTLPIYVWKKQLTAISKEPTVFLLQA